MFCPKCGNEVEQGAMFCPKCGNMLMPQEPVDLTKSMSDALDRCRIMVTDMVHSRYSSHISR